MNRLVAVGALDMTDVRQREYSACLATVGYEQRARFASQQLEPRAAIRTACAFAHRQGGAFAANRDWFVDAGYQVPVVGDDEAEEWSCRWLSEVLGRGESAIHMCVDVSSISRLRLASLLAAIMRAPLSVRMHVDFVYSMAKWSAPSEEPEPIVSVGAVLPCFAGWSSEPEQPIVVIVGLGYEPGKAVGAYEYLEATNVWAFIPTSGDPLYTRDVGRANESLLRRVPAAQRITYAVGQPFACFRMLEAIVYGARERERPVLLPFGPKVFALCAMLVSCQHREVPVWRISSGQFGEATDRVASGQIVGLTTAFESEL